MMGAALLKPVINEGERAEEGEQRKKEGRGRKEMETNNHCNVIGHGAAHHRMHVCCLFDTLKVLF